MTRSATQKAVVRSVVSRLKTKSDQIVLYLVTERRFLDREDLRRAPNDYFSGSIDSVKIFSYARTPAQIAWDYNRGAPVYHFKFEDCQGSTIHDSMSAANSGTLIGATPGTCDDGTGTTAWSAGREGKFNRSLKFDGVDDYVNVTIPTNYIQSVSFWAKPTTASQSFLQLNSGVNVVSTNGAVSGWTGANVYVNGKPNGTVVANSWNHVLLINTTSTAANAIELGVAGSSYYNGQLDEVKI